MSTLQEKQIEMKARQSKTEQTKPKTVQVAKSKNTGRKYQRKKVNRLIAKLNSIPLETTLDWVLRCTFYPLSLKVYLKERTVSDDAWQLIPLETALETTRETACSTSKATQEEDRRVYFTCPLPSSYGALKHIEDILKEHDKSSYEELISKEAFSDVKLGNPTREVYGDFYKAYTSAAARDLKRYNPQEKLKQILRSRVATAMRALRRKRNDPTLEKAGSAVKDLGCTLDFLEKHIEGQFQGGMTWDNYGEWEVDHIIPLAKLDLTNSEDFAKACHYSNLQPLWWQDNLKKSDKTSS